MSKPAQLGSGLIATKGAASPTIESPNKAVVLEKGKRKSITVKLLEEPYMKMKTYGALKRKSNQDILEQALNEYLEKVSNS